MNSHDLRQLIRLCALLTVLATLGALWLARALQP
jgi:hypothetical protein